MVARKKKVKWGDVWREHCEPLKFYYEQYNRLTRGQLKDEDKSLYERLRREGQLDIVPLEKSKSGRVSKFGEDPAAYYYEHYEGFARGELQKENFSLYQRLRNDGLLDIVPLKKPDFDDFPVEYYQEHYAGLSRTELKQTNKGLYNRLSRDGLLEHVALAKRGCPSKFGDDPLVYYHKHHKKLTRGELAKENRSLYNRLRRDGLLKQVPLKGDKKK